MLRALAALLVLSSASAFADEVELFVDHGDTFIRAGTEQGLSRGVTVPIVGGKERKQIGSATVMEVFPSLARVSLDEPTKADKTPLKYAVVAAAKKPEAVAPPAPPPPAVAAPPPAPRAAPQATGPLVGHAVFKGAGPWKVLQLFNDNRFGWSHCTLTLMPNNQRYVLPSLKADDHEAIAWSNFSGERGDNDPTWVGVQCTEGQVSLRFVE